MSVTFPLGQLTLLRFQFLSLVFLGWLPDRGISSQLEVVDEVCNLAGLDTALLDNLGLPIHPLRVERPDLSVE